MKYLQKMCSFNQVKIVGDLYFFISLPLISILSTMEKHTYSSYRKACIETFIRFINLSLISDHGYFKSKKQFRP